MDLGIKINLDNKEALRGIEQVIASMSKMFSAGSAGASNRTGMQSFGQNNGGQNPANSIASITGSLGSGTEAQAVKARLAEAKTILSKNLMDITNEEVLKLKKIAAELVGASAGGAITGLVQKDLARFSTALQTYVSTSMEKAIASVSGAGTGFSTKTTASLTGLLKSAGVGTSISDLGGTGLTSVLKQIQGQVPLTKAQTKEVNASFSEIGSTDRQSVVDAELLKISEILNAAIAKMARKKTEDVREAAVAAPTTAAPTPTEKVSRAVSTGGSGKSGTLKTMADSVTKFNSGTATTESEMASRANEYTGLLKSLDTAAKKNPAVAEQIAILKEELIKNNAAVAEYIAEKERALAAATTAVKTSGTRAPRGGRGAGSSPTAADLGAVAAAPPADPVVTATTDSFKASKKAAKAVVADAESLDAARKPSDAAITRSFNGLSSTLGNIRSTLTDVTKTAGAGGAVRDTATLTNLVNQTGQGLKDYLSAANQAFNTTSLKSGGKFPKDFLSTAMDSMITRTSGMSASEVQKNLAKGPLAKNIVSDMGLTGKEAELATKNLQKVFATVAQTYGVLTKASDELNISTLDLSKKHAMTVIEERKYAEAVDLLTKQTLARVEVGPGGVPRVKTGQIGTGESGKVKTAEELAAAGYTSKTAKAAEGTQEQVVKQAATVAAIKEGDGFLKQAARTAGSLMSVYAILQMTVGTVVQKLIQFTDEANKLEKASATVSAMAGSFNRYSSAITLATTQQAKFGGSLEEQMKGFTSLMPISKNYNVQLSQLDNIARRLAIVDPLQGFQGAAIALKEFFSGDVTSLSRRFEIDRKTLNSIKEAGDKAAQLQRLDEVLNKMGISQAVLAARTNTAAASFDRAGAAYGNFEVLMGQGLQEAFQGTADSVTSMFSFAGKEVAQNLLNQEQTNSILGNIGKIGEQYKDLKIILSENVDKNGFVTLRRDINASKESINDLIDQTNVFISQLNNIRRGKDEPLISRYTMREAPMAVRTSQIAQAGGDLDALLNARSVDRASFFGRRDSNAEYGSEKIAFRLSTALAPSEAVQKELGLSFAKIEKLAKSLSTNAERAEQFIQVSTLATARLTKSTDVVMQAANDRAMEKLVLSGGIKDFGISPKYKNVAVTYKDYTNPYNPAIPLAPGSPGKTIESSMQVRDYSAEVTEAMRLLLVKQEEAKTDEERLKYQEQYLALATEIATVQASALLIPQAIKSAREQAEGMLKNFNDISFAQTSINNAISTLNSKTEAQHTVMSDIVALEYSRTNASDRLGQLKLIEKAATLGIVDAEGKSTTEREAQLILLGKAAIYQAQLTLETDKSVSAAQALDSIWKTGGNIHTGLQEAVKLAMEFSSSLDNLASGSLLSTLPIADQLNFASSRLRPGTRENAVAGPNNAGEVFSIAQSALSLTQQSAQAVLDNARKQSKTADELLKMQRDHNKNVEDENKKFNDANTEADKKYREDMKKLQEQSETGKRGNKADFYESLLGMNLSPEQSRKYRDQYEGYQTEASNLRSQGKFTAAEGVLSAGSKSILDQAKYDKEVMDNNEKIKKDTKEIKELEKEKATAKNADDAKSIQDKIDAINLDKTQAQIRIDQIAGLRVLRQEADDEELKQARLKEEGITKNYEEEMAKRKKDHDDKLGEMETKYKESVKEKQKADDAQTKAQISNMDTVLALYQYQVDFMNYSKLVASNASKEDLMEARKGLYQSQTDILKSATGTEAYTTLKDMFTSLETGLKGSSVQTDKALDYQATQLLALGDGTTATKNLTTSIDDLNATFKELTSSTSERGANGQFVTIRRLRVIAD
jgi:hypothetical protein